MRLKISTQPISTMRSPPAGLSPVVSVSKTISRTPALSSRGEAETSENMADLRFSCGQIAAGLDDEIGALALVRVGHLPRQDGIELLRRHAGPREHSGTLHRCRRGDDDDLVERAFAAGFEQQWNVEQQGARG